MESSERANFELGVKAVEVSTDSDGTLYIEGYAADFQTDRDNEYFLPDAFEQGLKAYMASNPILLYHHNPAQALGRVVTAALDGKGLKIKAAIPKPTAGSWAELVYDQVQKGIIRGFSVGGAFGRIGQKIAEVDLQEISVTPLPVNPRTLFTVAGKAFGTRSGADELNRSLDALGAALEQVEKRLD